MSSKVLVFVSTPRMPTVIAAIVNNAAFNAKTPPLPIKGSIIPTIIGANIPPIRPNAAAEPAPIALALVG
jgi:hypothetical protein